MLSNFTELFLGVAFTALVICEKHAPGSTNNRHPSGRELASLRLESAVTSTLSPVVETAASPLFDDYLEC